jgi:hypothetical protein
MDVEDASMLEGNEDNIVEFSAVLLCFDVNNANSFHTVSKLAPLMTKFVSRGIEF